MTGQTNGVIVGQQMNLYCQLSITNLPFTNLVITNFSWTIPGDEFLLISTIDPDFSCDSFSFCQPILKNCALCPNTTARQS